MRTRFAPSPTGLLHVGGLRTALFNYLIAKKTGGTFILRIEDTDQEREEDGALENILSTLNWAGISPDEGVVLKDGKITELGDYGPYTQSNRLDIYKKYVKELVDNGHAYLAFDTKEELDQMREQEQKAGNPSPKYDYSIRMRMCNSLTLSSDEVSERLKKNTPHVIRLKTPEGRKIQAQDIIRGKVEFQSHTIDDAVLLKSDGFPTYHLANVVDDHLMEIDLVIRGEEWLPSLPKHILLYEAFGWKAPEFAHVPLLMNQGGGKLSKRQGDVSASIYSDKGYLPGVMINFLALLGWNPGTTEEIFTMSELIEKFSLDRIQKAGAVFDTEKLDWLQGQWIRRMTVIEFADLIRPIVAEKYPDANNDDNFLSRAGLIQERITFFNEAPEMFSYIYERPSIDKKLIANKKQKVTLDIVPKILSVIIEDLNCLGGGELDWNLENLKTTLFALAESKGYKNGQILWPMRAILTGLPYSPGAFEVAEILGREETLDRLKEAQKAF
ncbi:glutamate--tRNA ligase [Candidatus Peregrinibacteria bacterium]|jgi:glutamyl-tRNA synthetase|nr:glutamate--tRNA ligase [Candidatus Peregrinibacteria bacterium]MBT3598287.1 glutamate--tRNA ligase [Candidatus Peregrinibacteria bacterium]MBT6731040.1 glutamate--tRNA ligase [Candidatus Peregrinibacteria bacterium]MBT7009075.1 glutamate--tRNA ligase [Candidatus Peregrinibacteria bacterium]MBT7345335.1 glutamate--tRNA ligase [Candidatus Peregrinibacteria bacterium]